jgi:hypothetical protein
MSEAGARKVKIVKRAVTTKTYILTAGRQARIANRRREMHRFRTAMAALL